MMLGYGIANVTTAIAGGIVLQNVTIHGDTGNQTNSGNIQAASFSTPGGTGYTGNVMIQTNAIGPHGWTQMMSGGIITNMVQY